MRLETMNCFNRTGIGGDAVWWLGLDSLANRAVTAFQKARNARPDNAAAHYGLGCALIALREQNKARASFCRAEQLRPPRFRPDDEFDEMAMLTQLCRVCTAQRGKFSYEQP
jgi:hypothetical protein